LSWRVSSCARPDSSTSSWTYSQVSIPNVEISNIRSNFFHQSLNPIPKPDI
jgi:hypothetical protein